MASSHISNYIDINGVYAFAYCLPRLLIMDGSISPPNAENPGNRIGQIFLDTWDDDWKRGDF